MDADNQATVIPRPQHLPVQETVTRTFRLTPELYEELRAQAFRERVSMNSLVVRALREMLGSVPARHDERIQPGGRVYERKGPSPLQTWDDPSSGRDVSEGDLDALARHGEGVKAPDGSTAWTRPGEEVGGGQTAPATHRADEAEVCACGHPPSKHVRVHHQTAGSEYGSCTVCPCRTYRGGPRE